MQIYVYICIILPNSLFQGSRIWGAELVEERLYYPSLICAYCVYRFSTLLLLLQGALLFRAADSLSSSKALFGEIRSPNYPKPYPNNNISSWNIAVPKGFKVKLNFWLFDMEPSEGCRYDFVKVCEPWECKISLINVGVSGVLSKEAHKREEARK